jgi:hypothetical protein
MADQKVHHLVVQKVFQRAAMKVYSMVDKSVAQMAGLTADH